MLVKPDSITYNIHQQAGQSSACRTVQTVGESLAGDVRTPAVFQSPIWFKYEE